jgi:hypothetical protein
LRLADLKRERLIDQVCIDEILPPEEEVEDSLKPWHIAMPPPPQMSPARVIA